ncbi:MAG: two-component system, OmpR family, sensor histidine kinase SenX3 [Acidimicrobiaceae bacterium]|nr:two-component system, OmpR family, sensor histidine kinase SenX3 [Acidimicrobiaceae bacterium]
MEYERGVALARAERLAADVGRLRAALDVLPIGVVVVDDKGVESFRNRRAAAPVGDVGSDAIITGALATLLSPPVAGPRREVVTLHGPPPRTVEVRAEPLPAGGAVAILEDTSERTRLESVRRDFVANVNHELRTPIGALGVLAEAVQGETDPDVVGRLTDRMLAEVARAQALIEDLLDLSRIEHAAERASDWIAVGEILDAAAQRVQALAEGRQVAIEVTASSDSLWGEPTELVSAIGNLLDNAVKYSEAGSSVEVGSRTDGLFVEITVRDHGAGIPAKDLDRVFERFYRVDRARDRRTGGSGLGLSIVRHVAVNHGGEVFVESVEGQGSTFTLRLPQRPST